MSMSGVTVAPGGLIIAFGEPGQKRKDLIRGDGFQISLTKLLFEGTKQKFIIFYGIFFSN